MTNLDDSKVNISVVICAYNPNKHRLQRTLEGLARQTFERTWELIIVDNGSSQPISIDSTSISNAAEVRILTEARPGLSYARAMGFENAKASLVILVDDDNVLVDTYLSDVFKYFEQYPYLGVIGGPCRPEFEAPHEEWLKEFYCLLALRDLGPDILTASGLNESGKVNYPAFAPVGAGMAIKRDAFLPWLSKFRSGHAGLTDRKGAELTSSGDNDIVIHAMESGFGVGYFPELSLLHLIPADRLEVEYLKRLNFGIQKSWMQVLTLHGINPWPSLTRFGSIIRCGRAWLKLRPWQSESASIKYAGVCGSFNGRVAGR